MQNQPGPDFMTRAIKQLAGPPRLTADQLIVMKLFEIADALALREPKGFFESEIIDVGTSWVETSFGPSISCSMINKGPAEVYVRMWDREHGEGDPGPGELPWVRKQAPVDIGMHIMFNVATLKAVRMWLICKSGTTKVYKYSLS